VASEPKLAKAKGGALCVSCHADVVRNAKAKGGHAPASDGCVGCHDPHGSEAPRLLAQPEPALCAGCHDPLDEDLVGKHLGADLAKLDCGSCHDPHGSPGGRLLLAASRHAPFVDGGCDTCHEGGSATTFAGGGGRDLCLACHANVEEEAAKPKVRHAALDGECTACHGPHASGRPKLLRGRGGEACGSCHDGQVAAKGEFAHGVIASLGCEACHEPHGGGGERLLRVSGDGLCLACHDRANLKPDGEAGVVKLLGRFAIDGDEAAAIRTVSVGPAGPVNHPVAGHRSSGPPPPASRVSPRTRSTFQGKMRCLTCHDPHKGKSSRLFVQGAASVTQSCLQCHPK
jgi:predicted CXXCH cytochrome family protein